MDIKSEQRGVAPEVEDEKEIERRWCWEMAEQLRKHQGQSGSRDINVRAYEVATSIGPGGRTWVKVLPEIVANREALNPAGRRYLLKRLKLSAKAERERAAKAEQRAQRYEALIAQLDAPKHV